MLDFGYPLSSGNGMLCCKGRHPLQIECFVIFPYFHDDDWRNFEWHNRAPYGPHHIIPSKNNHQISWNISDLRNPLSKGNGILCYNERHSLLLEYSITFFQHIRMIGKAFGSIYETLILFTPCSFGQCPLSNCIQENTRFQVPSWQWKWYVVLQGGISIAVWVFHNLLYLHSKNASRSFEQH